MTLEREKYLAKCSKMEQQIRMLIKYYKYELKKDKAVCSSYDLKGIGRKPFGYRLSIGKVKQDKTVITALRRELARLKGMDRVAVPMEQYSIYYGAMLGTAQNASGRLLLLKITALTVADASCGRR